MRNSTHLAFADLDRLAASVVKLVAPSERLSVSRWADERRVLSAESCAEPGTWRTARAEYQRAMMDAIMEPSVETVTLMTAARVGKTEIINNILGRFIDNEPCPILSVNPTVEMAEAWSKKYFAPMIRDTPCLRSKVTEARTRDSNNTILEKSFPGGYVAMAGANSPAGLASRTVMIVVLDEVDRFPPSAGTEGDPVELAKKRTETFTYRKKFVQTSTPTIQGISRIEQEWNESDQRHYYVACPRCREYQTLVWSQVKFDKTDLDSVHYECRSCSGRMEEVEKAEIIRHGQWRPTYPERKRHAGFHLNALYSPWISWREVVEKFLAAKKRPETLKVWVNTMLGESWQEEESYSISDEKLAVRREDYEDPPAGVLILTAGIDVQDDRLECVIKGWGLNDESWFIDYKVFYGSPGREDTWALLEGFLGQSFKHELGLQLHVQSACIDSGGHFTQAVYRFIAARRRKRIFAIKGMGGYGRQMIGLVSRNNKLRVPVFPVGVDTAKELIYDRLEIEEPGPGYMHFNQKCNEEYFRQLTAEKHITRYHKGYPTKAWELKAGRRNEALDCEVYALAAFALLNAPMKSIAAGLAKRAEAERQQRPAPAQKLDVVRRRPLRLKLRWMDNW